MRKDRLDRVVRLQRETAALAQPYLTELYAAKNRQLQAVADQAEASADLERILSRLEAEVVAFIDANRAEFEAASLPVEACKELMTLAMRETLDSRRVGEAPFRAPVALLEKFPEELRPLLSPARPPD